jgi:3-oxoadipate enol-lactonase
MPLHEINGQWLHYEDTGGKLGPVVLAHGVLMDHEMFAPQIAARNSDVRIITWDARCHGETETTDDPFTYWDLADDLRGLLDHLDIQRAVIGGAGQGGFVSLRFALKYPQRVAALILLDTQAGAEDPRKVAMYEAMLDVWETEGLNDQLAEAIAAIILGNDWLGRHAWIAKWRRWPRSLLRPAVQALVGREDIHDRLGEITAPALVMHGTADAAIDVELAELLCSELANCQPLITIEGGGHACNLTHPKLVNLVLQQYLSKLALRTPRGAERRVSGRRSNVKRRFGERRNPVRAKTGRRVLFPFERRIAERRAHERRESWPGLGLWKPGAYS